jgi:hypothetical protein
VKRLRWDMPERRPAPKHPIRDSALVYALMAVVIVVVGVATGGSLGRSLVIAALFYAAAMAWAVVRWRQKLRDEEGR